MLLTGCNRLPDSEPVAETSEPAYVEGKRLLRQGNEQGALASFTRVIGTRADGAPESHLEVGLLYQLEIKDPIIAIYHFRRYLELKPNSAQADLVRQRIDAATREFARTLPAQPLENQARRNDMLDVVQRLQSENTRLKDEIATLRSNTGSVSVPVRPRTSGMAITSAPEPTPTTAANPTPGRTVTAPTRPDEAPAARPAGQRVHTVVKGDTLYSLARHYYSNSTRAKDIYAANRGVMKSQNDLQIGMQLVIP